MTTEKRTGIGCQNPSLPASTMLSAAARKALIEAATNPNLSDRERTMAIEKATSLARRINPKLFKEIEP